MHAPGYAEERPRFRGALPHAMRRNGATHFFLILPLVGGIFLSRFALPLGGRRLAVPLLVILASIVGLAVFGRLRVHLPRLILFVLSMVAMMTAAASGGAGRVSAMSFLLLAVLYLSYVFIIDGDETTYAWVISAFRRIY